jgi:hypothetical protein
VGLKRSWLSPEKWAKARGMRLRMAERGERRPVRVVEGIYRRMSGICPWGDARASAGAEAARRG